MMWTRGAGPDGAIHLPDNVKQTGIHVGGLLDPPVAQKVVELLQGFWNVGIASPERNCRAFLRMGVEERKGAARIERVGALCGEGCCRNACEGESREETCPS